MTLDGRLAIGFVVLMAIFPYALLRGRARNLYAAVDAATYAALAAIWFASPILGVAIDVSLAFAFLLVIKIAFFTIVLAASPEGVGPNAAAVFAGAIYLLLIPHVLQWPIDGDEPFYLLVTESIVRDVDLDLVNQYANLDRSSVGRPDLQPQPGDPVGLHGEQYSRHEPFLSILLLPGFLIAGLHGAVVTLAIFGALFIRSFLLFLEEEGISARTRALLFPLVAFGPPVLFYATRIWPEVPAAFFLTEALRAIRADRRGSLAGALLALSLLKLRFIPIAVTLLVLDFLRRRDRKTMVWIAMLLLIPLAIVAMISGNALNVHGLGELMPGHPLKYLRGLFGLLLDAQTGLLFQAPLWFAGLFAVIRWRELPRAIRLGALSSLPYLVLLFPRDEWHGGWSPALRYLVVFAPLFGFGAAFVLERVRGSVVALIGIGTGALVVHGVAFPWRLFHIANGESVAGEWLSTAYRADFSRLFPSFIRPNRAAIVASILMILAMTAAFVLWRHAKMRPASHLLVGALAIMVGGGWVIARTPGSSVELEDAHVVQEGGTLYPHLWTVARFRFRGGWTLNEGEGVSFRMRGGPSRVRYQAATDARIDIDGREFALPATGGGWAEAAVEIPSSDRVRLRCVGGEVTLDRIVHE